MTAYVISCWEPYECPRVLAVCLAAESLLGAVENERKRARVVWSEPWRWGRASPGDGLRIPDPRQAWRRAATTPEWPGCARALFFGVAALEVIDKDAI